MKKLFIIMAIVALTWGAVVAENPDRINKYHNELKLWSSMDSRIRVLEDRVKALEENQWGSGVSTQEGWKYIYN